MKIARALLPDGRPTWCATEDGQHYFRYEPGRDSRGEALEVVRLLAPVTPTKIVAVGLNYRDHAREVGLDLPQTPMLFLKPASCVIGPGEDIRYPEQSSRVDFEAELAVVIARRCSRIAPDEAPAYILGLTCFNDVTARDLQVQDGQWTRAKSFDTFGPVGPWIATGLAGGGLRIEARLNGEVRQSSSTDNLIFPVPELVAFISHVMTLEAGDLIATGTPAGIAPMERGDTVEVEIEGIGVLKNRVV